VTNPKSPISNPQSPIPISVFYILYSIKLVILIKIFLFNSKIYINIKMETKKDSLIGKIFFKTYKIKKMLGEGSFGKIYVAYDINSKEEYAVKLVCK